MTSQNQSGIDPTAAQNRESMEPSVVEAWLEDAKSGKIGWTEFAERILANQNPATNADQPDLDRGRRCAFGEVIYGSGKTPEGILSISQKLIESGQREVLVTRVAGAEIQQIEQANERLRSPLQLRYEPLGRTLRIGCDTVGELNVPPCPALADVHVAVVTAGTTDREVGMEAVETLRWMGVNTHWLQDVGVAGPYRLLGHLEELRRCAVVVVVAGMEGALASVMGGLVPCPVIAVPTSVGYGSNFEGITTLLSMMSSCAAGVTVVNIDGGFKGGYIAGLMAFQVAKAASK
ncbi:MAG: nickel pincer cofactor biosynthesis protein LarB [Planctomycetota bacterium]